MQGSPLNQSVAALVEAAQTASTLTGLGVLITFVDASELRTVVVPPFSQAPGQACLLCGGEH